MAVVVMAREVLSGLGLMGLRVPQGLGFRGYRF